ncbi:MAG: hypothetical protein L6R40_008675 [Gallowayella cf. fulva]|nr:MAG: hypothetical protein L6R40_008675 [Xanthomendoza cf. fulva]
MRVRPEGDLSVPLWSKSRRTFVIGFIVVVRASYEILDDLFCNARPSMSINHLEEFGAGIQCDDIDRGSPTLAALAPLHVSVAYIEENNESNTLLDRSFLGIFSQTRVTISGSETMIRCPPDRINAGVRCFRVVYSKAPSALIEPGPIHEPTRLTEMTRSYVCSNA